MIVGDIMSTTLVTIEPEATLGQAVHILRQHHFHHLPVAHTVRNKKQTRPGAFKSAPILLLKGLLTIQDVELAIALAKQKEATLSLAYPWQDIPLNEIMPPVPAYVTPMTSIAAATQVFIDRGINCLPVIEPGQGGEDVLVGLLSRSDILHAMIRLLGASEPGFEIRIALPLGGLAPLVRALVAAEELHVPVSSLVIIPWKLEESRDEPRQAILRVATINPGPFLRRLIQEGIQFASGQQQTEEQNHVTRLEQA
ncbi:acetoin dehydrogenase [Ktedonobacter sp. SOSP1-85]|uniref:CBS domain-containing protein n=1 Tax=Ktedonobacter sp. SOSP1-85 TaxID=2778367 RepID=UPI00191607DD|nr:CBS domain-containing protein [Ktedonobacter sp. SOSP1-85]GHO80224.1 acetoin dehydrogenase [Ktedonobacter sp. SOSP1-85]